MNASDSQDPAGQPRRRRLSFVAVHPETANDPHILSSPMVACSQDSELFAHAPSVTDSCGGLATTPPPPSAAQDTLLHYPPASAPFSPPSAPLGGGGSSNSSLSGPSSVADLFSTPRRGTMADPSPSAAPSGTSSAVAPASPACSTPGASTRTPPQTVAPPAPSPVSLTFGLPGMDSSVAAVPGPAAPALSHGSTASASGVFISPSRLRSYNLFMMDPPQSPKTPTKFGLSGSGLSPRMSPTRASKSKDHTARLTPGGRLGSPLRDVATFLKEESDNFNELLKSPERYPIIPEEELAALGLQSNHGDGFASPTRPGSTRRAGTFEGSPTRGVGSPTFGFFGSPPGAFAGGAGSAGSPILLSSSGATSLMSPPGGVGSASGISVQSPPTSRMLPGSPSAMMGEDAPFASPPPRSPKPLLSASGRPMLSSPPHDGMLAAASATMVTTSGPGGGASSRDFDDRPPPQSPVPGDRGLSLTDVSPAVPDAAMLHPDSGCAHLEIDDAEGSLPSGWATKQPVKQPHVAPMPEDLASDASMSPDMSARSPPPSSLLSGAGSPSSDTSESGLSGGPASDLVLVSPPPATGSTSSTTPAAAALSDPSSSASSEDVVMLGTSPRPISAGSGSGSDPVPATAGTGAGTGTPATALAARIPQFYFPFGRPEEAAPLVSGSSSSSSLLALFAGSSAEPDRASPKFLAQVIAPLFRANGGVLGEQNFLEVTRACGLSPFLNLSLFMRAGHGAMGAPAPGTAPPIEVDSDSDSDSDSAGSGAGSTAALPHYSEVPESVSYESFCDFWTTLHRERHCPASRTFAIIASGGLYATHLTNRCFAPVVLSVVNLHPNLDFLREASHFLNRYVQTVCIRVFYHIDRGRYDRITLAQWRRARLHDLIAQLERINVSESDDFFSYKHFYVIYCKFWELDTDHDGVISRADLQRYEGGTLTSRIVDRVARGWGLCAPKAHTQCMNYHEFCWFLLSEVDKTTETAMEYWFHCLDMDGDGILSMYEIEFFYEEQLMRLRQANIDAFNFEDMLCQMLDYIHPARGTVLTLADIRKSGFAPLFFDTLFNLARFIDHESRDPAAIRRERLKAKVSDWIKFVDQEYSTFISMEEDEPETRQSSCSGGYETASMQHGGGAEQAPDVEMAAPDGGVDDFAK
ncbi:hypothetical protein H696_00125, partial [Fonticula alba]